ncbi:MAG: flagellar hook-basal body complex protein FliE [Gammaproteobacteria bacterium HGW-Gammaproteobacteria-3]|nr:MAG: flagellar hook-basal body complex protein FliE [Gammaproteobacteria bacterium HGW-Gammaproteobacteria-3]
MSDINVNQLLAQIRTMSIEAASKPQQTSQAEQTDFASLLKESIDAVNSTQKTAGKMVNAFETGSSDVSLAEVMVATQKAGISFQAMLQVRNKLVDAYQEVMNMPM